VGPPMAVAATISAAALLTRLMGHAVKSDGN
jgi:hypothetical protein